jgi:hypothetical protein
VLKRRRQSSLPSNAILEACVEFKSHPYYDGSESQDWLTLRPGTWGELEPGPDKNLQDLLRADKAWLCELALSQIRAAAGESYLAERPVPCENEFLFHPINDCGYQVYVEYFFAKRPNEASYEIDYWWAIIQCPYAVAPFPSGRREAYVIGVGWYIA